MVMLCGQAGGRAGGLHLQCWESEVQRHKAAADNGDSHGRVCCAPLVLFQRQSGHANSKSDDAPILVKGPEQDVFPRPSLMAMFVVAWVRDLMLVNRPETTQESRRRQAYPVKDEHAASQGTHPREG